MQKLKLSHAVILPAYILCILYFHNCRRSSAETSQCNSKN